MAIPSLQVLVRTFGHYAAGLGVRGFEVLGKLGLYILAAAALGAHDAGLFFLCITWVGLLSTIARAGFERAMTRHIAAEIAVGRGRAAGRAMRTGMSVHVATGVAAALFTWATADFVAGSVFSQPDLARQALDHLAEAEILALHDEVDGVAVRAATEAMEGAAPLVDGEGGRLLLVEGAQALHHRARARQAHAPAHRLGQADPGLQFLDEGRRKGQDAPSPAVARCVSRAPASPARWRG